MSTTDENGFTLVELLVVVAILGILAAITIPQYLSQRERAWAAELTSAVVNIALAVEGSAAASQGLYVGPNGAFSDKAAFDDFLQQAIIDLTAVPADPVSYDALHGTATATRYEFCMEHVQLQDGGVPTLSVTYVSDAGGLQDPADGGC